MAVYGTPHCSADIKWVYSTMVQTLSTSALNLSTIFVHINFYALLIDNYPTRTCTESGKAIVKLVMIDNETCSLCSQPLR